MRAKLVNEDFAKWPGHDGAGWKEEGPFKYGSSKEEDQMYRAKYRAEDKARNERFKTLKKVYVLPIGVVSPANGNTMYDWNIYTSWPEGWAFLVRGGFLLFSSDENDFDIGEDVVLYGNDSQRRLTGGETVIDKSPVIKDELINMLYKHHYDYKPKRAFQKAAFSSKLRTSYSVKGIE